MYVLVTGGAKRLGAALCQAIARNGFNVAIHYRQSEQEAHEVVQACEAFGVKAKSIQGDFSTINGIIEFSERIAEQIPDIYGLVNNVGEYLIQSALNTSIEDWMHLFQVNLHAPFILSQKLTPALIKSKGRIINIGVSGLYRQSGNTFSTAYSLSKEGLWGLTRSLAKELAPKQVCVNMISPGILDIAVDIPTNLNAIPIRRLGTCEEIARVVVFLLDKESSYITGQNIEVAGGLGLK